jgi:hypothetical protein
MAEEGAHLASSARPAWKDGALLGMFDQLQIVRRQMVQ